MEQIVFERLPMLLAQLCVFYESAVAGQSFAVVFQLFLGGLFVDSQCREGRCVVYAPQGQQHEVGQHSADKSVEHPFHPPQMADGGYFLSHDDDVARDHQGQQPQEEANDDDKIAFHICRIVFCNASFSFSNSRVSSSKASLSAMMSLSTVSRLCCQ